MVTLGTNVINPNLKMIFTILCSPKNLHHHLLQNWALF